MNRALFTTLTAASVAAPAVALAQSAATVRIGTAPVESYFLSYFARESGAFARNGIDAQIQVVPGASGGITAALVGGAIDVGCVSIGPTSNAHLRGGVPIRLVAPGGICLAPTPTTVMIVPKTSTIKSAKDFNGKTIGTSVLRDLQHVATLKWIDINGGDSKTVKIVEMPLGDANVALAAGRIDGYPQVEPLLSFALANDMRAIGGIYEAITKRLMISMHIAMAEWTEKNAPVAKRFVTAMHEAAQWANTNRPAAAETLAQITKIPPAVIAKMNHVVMGESIEIPTIQPQIDAMADYGFIATRYNVADIIWSGARG